MHSWCCGHSGWNLRNACSAKGGGRARTAMILRTPRIRKGSYRARNAFLFSCSCSFWADDFRRRGNAVWPNQAIRERRVWAACAAAFRTRGSTAWPNQAIRARRVSPGRYGANASFLLDPSGKRAQHASQATTHPCFCHHCGVLREPFLSPLPCAYASLRCLKGPGPSLNLGPPFALC